MWKITRSISILLLVGFSVVIGFSSCLSVRSPPSTSPAPDIGAGAGSPDPSEFEQFAEDCRRDVDAWQRGAAVFPKTLTVKLDESVTYLAGVEIQGGTDLERRLNADGNYSNEPVAVRCGLGAKLTSASDGVQIDESDWVMQRFEEPGTVEWSWLVKGKKPGAHDLTLQLRPAVAVVGGGYVVPAGDSSTPTANFTTKLDVTATALQDLYLWWDANWGKIVAIGSALGAAVLGVLTWVRRLRTREASRPGTPWHDRGGPQVGTFAEPSVDQEKPTERSSPPQASGPSADRG